MRPEDVPLAERVTAHGFHQLALQTRRVDRPEPTLRPAERAGSWVARVVHLLQHDPQGCWVAEDDDGVFGVAVSMRRDLTWVLSTYAVQPGRQGTGVGTQLLDAALTHARNCIRGMISASEDQGAVRRYRGAGFTLHPMMYLTGRVDRSALPVVEHVREGSAADVDLMNSIDRRVRDAAHGVDHEFMTREHRLLVKDDRRGSGYVYLEPGGSDPYLLAATDRRTATDLLWECFAGAPEDTATTVGHVTAEQGWAIDVGMAARLGLHIHGYLALRGMRPPAPYLPSGHFL